MENGAGGWLAPASTFTKTRSARGLAGEQRQRARLGAGSAARFRKEHAFPMCLFCALGTAVDILTLANSAGSSGSLLPSPPLAEAPPSAFCFLSFFFSRRPSPFCISFVRGRGERGRRRAGSPCAGLQVAGHHWPRIASCPAPPPGSSRGVFAPPGGRGAPTAVPHPALARPARVSPRRLRARLAGLNC